MYGSTTTQLLYIHLFFFLQFKVQDDYTNQGSINVKKLFKFHEDLSQI